MPSDSDTRSSARAARVQVFPPRGAVGRPLWSYLVEGVAIVLGYYFLVRLNFRYTPPPAGIGPIWLPAGLAFGLVLVRGYWTLVPLAVVVIGDKLLGDLILRPRHDAEGFKVAALEVVLAALVYAAGVLGHSLLGAWLVRRGLRNRDIESARDALWFLVAAGPLSCLVSAVLGTTGFVMDGYVSREAFLSSAFTFWVGDAIACILVGTAMYAVAGGRSWGSRRLVIVLLAIATAGFVLATTQIVGRTETENVRSRFRADSMRGVDAVERDVNALIRSAHTLSVLAAEAPTAERADAVEDASRTVRADLERVEIDEIRFVPLADAERVGIGGLDGPALVKLGSGDAVTFDGAASGEQSVLIAPARRGDELVGFVRIDIDLEALVGRAFAHTDSRNMAAVVSVDHASPPAYVGTRPIDGNPLVDDEVDPLAKASETQAKFVLDEPVRLIDPQPWRVTVAASSVWVSQRALLKAVMPVALISMAFTFTIMMLGLTSTGQRARLGRLVRARTAQLRNTEQRYSSVVDSVQDAIFQLDGNDRIEFVNEAWGAAFGPGTTLPRLGSDIVDALPVDHPERVHELLAQARAARGEVIRGELAGRGATMHWDVRLVADPAGPASESPGIVGVISDVTSHHGVLRNREQFVSLIAHELRNPLAVISGSIETIAVHDSGELPEVTSTLLPAMRTSSERLQRIIGDLLVASQVDAGTLKLHVERADLADVARRACASVEVLAAEHSITVDAPPDGEAPVEGTFDTVRISQVFDNLLSNALKYTPDGGRVSVAVGREPSDGTLRATVTDTGIGVAREDLARIFERFARTEAGAAFAAGTGLGLPICHGIATAHGGRIEVSSTLGAGSTFTVVLPATSELAD